MFSELQDFGLIIIFLSAFGFIVVDAFRIGRYWGIPDLYRSNIERIFHYLSIAILAIIGVIFVFTFLIAKYPSDFIVRNVSIFFLKLGLTDENYITLFSLSFMYLFFYSIAFLLGMGFSYLRAIWIDVSFLEKGEVKTKTFAGLITESNDFYFFEKEDNMLWEAIRKNDIIRMERIRKSSRFIRDFKKLKEKFYIFLSKMYSLIKNLFEEIRKLSML